MADVFLLKARSYGGRQEPVLLGLGALRHIFQIKAGHNGDHSILEICDPDMNDETSLYSVSKSLEELVEFLEQQGLDLL